MSILKKLTPSFYEGERKKGNKNLMYILSLMGLFYGDVTFHVNRSH